MTVNPCVTVCTHVFYLYRATCLTPCVTACMTEQPQQYERVWLRTRVSLYHYTHDCIEPRVWLWTTCMTLTSSSYTTLCRAIWCFSFWRWSDAECRGCTHHHVGVSNCLHFVHIVIFNGGIETRVEIVQKVHNLQHRAHILRHVKNTELLYISLFWGFEWCGRPGQQTRRGGKLGGNMNVLTAKKFDFLLSTNWKLLRRMQGNSRKDRDFFKVHNFY